jgi:hypothetical protein
MPLVLLNLLIAIMGDTFGRVSESNEVEDQKEKLNWILEITKFFKFMNRESDYQHIHKVRAFTGSDKDTTLEERVKKLKKHFRKELAVMTEEVKKLTKEQEAANRYTEM